jgi:lysophospholipid acyltransferase (LPLAT)-like uncharacterized protein
MLEKLLPSGLTTLIRSLRFKWKGEPLPDKCIVVFWHSMMIGGWWIARKGSVALVSKSKDGEYLNSILTKWGYKVVRGSSSSSGKEALDDAIDMVQNGQANRIVITPDGPRGPREIFKRGAIIASQKLQLPLYFLSIEYKDGMQLLKSWDKFQIPYPLSSVIITPHKIDSTDFPSHSEAQKVYLEKISLPFRITGSVKIKK